jgi:hypothetical protein
MYKIHNPKADTDRLYVKMKEGKRGLLQIEAKYKAETINIAEYLNTKYKDQFVNIVKSHKSNQPNMNSTIKTAAKVAEELRQSNENSDTKKEGVQHTKARLGESLKKEWESKVMNGQYIRSIDRQLIGEEDTFLWLLRGDLKVETESEIIAAKDLALQIKYHAMKILQTEADSKCRLCQQFDKTIDHITSVFPILATEQYTKRHDRVCAQLVN